ncbi:ROK family transcriptional regulator [Aquiluna sp.]|nr:ROK family transcriptional regulator [Aquiluna sp.]
MPSKTTPMFEARASGQSSLSTVLGLIHGHRAITRSEICSITGLSRSTVAKLVTALVDLGFAFETGSEQIDRVGRPSMGVEASKEVLAISVHPEVDYLEVKAVAFDGSIVRSEKLLYDEPIDTHQAVGDMVHVIENLVAELQASDTSYRILGIGVIVPGQINSSTGIVRQAPHLQWYEFPIRDLLTQRVPMPVFVANDASLGCKAEMAYGAAKGATDVVYMHGTSGIGGGVFMNGTELKGFRGYAAELGHMRISSGNDIDYSGIPGTLEALVRRDDLEVVLGLKNVSDEELEEALLNNRTPASTALARKQLEALGIATANLANIFNPEVFVLAGFLRFLYRFDQNYFHRVVKKHAIPAVLEGMQVFVNELGANSLAIGASELVFQEVIADPTKYGTRAN